MSVINPFLSKKAGNLDIDTTRTFSCECKVHLVLFKIMIGACDNKSWNIPTNRDLIISGSDN